MHIDALLAYLFDGQSNSLAPAMAGWLRSSRRYATFVATYRDKIRKKIRTTQDQNNLLDLQLELETAYLLLQERTLSLEYEPEQSRGTRSPDFAVNFTTSLSFMLEVTRVRAERSLGDEPRAPTPPAARLADAVGGKLSQLLPQCSNILLVGVQAAQLLPNEVRDTMLGMQQRAERDDSAFLRAAGFRDRAEFFRHLQRLSEVVVRAPRAEGDSSVIAWVNPQAKHSLPGRVRTVLYRSIRA